MRIRHKSISMIWVVGDVDWSRRITGQYLLGDLTFDWTEILYVQHKFMTRSSKRS